MRIERGDHAVDGAFHQLGIVGLLDIAGTNPLEHVAEQVELRIGIVAAGGGLGRGDQMRPLRPGHQEGQRDAGDGAEEKGDIPAHLPSFSLSAAKIHLNRRPGPGAAKQHGLFGRIKAVSFRGITGLLTMQFWPKSAGFEGQSLSFVVPAKAGTPNAAAGVVAEGR